MFSASGVKNQAYRPGFNVTTRNASDHCEKIVLCIVKSKINKRPRAQSTFIEHLSTMANFSVLEIL